MLKNRLIGALGLSLLIFASYSASYRIVEHLFPTPLMAYSTNH